MSPMNEKRHEVPSLERAVEVLREVSESTNLTATSLLLDADIDSLDFVEWMEALGLEDVDLDDTTLYELLEEGTVADLYDAIVRFATSS